MRTDHFKRTLTMLLALSGVALGTLVSGCEGSPVEMGQECELSGNEDDCVEGGICTRLTKPDQAPCVTMMCPAPATYNVCLPLCEAEQVCPAGTKCKRVSDSWKGSCQPDGIPVGSAAGTGGGGAGAGGTAP